MPPKILVLSLATGTGHVQVGAAIEAYARREYPNLDIVHLDVANYISPRGRFWHQQIYATLSRYAKPGWGLLYRLTNFPALARLINYSGNQSAAKHEQKLHAAIEKFRPTAIIITYFGCAPLLAPWIWRQSRPPLLAQVITDYHVHAAFVRPEIDCFFAPTSHEERSLIKAGIDQAKIVVSGIPIQPKYYDPIDTNALRTKLHLPLNQPIILLAGGGAGAARLDTLVRELFKQTRPLTIVAAAGKNQTLYQNLQKLIPPPHLTLRVLPWTELMPDYVRLADVIITKPGGVSITEAIVSQKPLILLASTAGQESHNARFVVNLGLGQYVRSAREINRHLDQLLRNPPRPLPLPQLPPAKIILDTIIKKTS